MRRIAISVLLILAALVLSGCGGHKLGKPALDISDATYAIFDADWNIVVRGIHYEYSDPYVPVREPVDLAESASAKELRDRVIAYFINDDRYVFFCESKHLDPSEWLICVPDNGRSALRWEDACWIKAQDVGSIPAWLELRDTSQ